MAGKHRAPVKHTYARSALTTAAIAATTTIIPAPSAQGATLEQWEQVAFCESTNRWDINTGNGYYGGLQFKQSTWVEFGGRQFAQRADLATKAQQITVAERVLASQGKRAWPVCGRALTTDVSPNLGTNPPNQPRANSTGSYTVQSGDTLSAIAQRFSLCTTELARLNRIPDPNFIRVGQQLQLGSAAKAEPNVSPNLSNSRSTQPQQTIDLIRAAKAYLGTPYLYGGTTRRGIDCSALVQNSFASIGKTVARTADAQYRAARKVPRESIAPGDLAFAVNTNNRAYHVAIYIGQGQVLEAPRSGLNVRIVPLYSSLNRFGEIT